MEVLPYDDKDGVQEILSNEALLEKDLKGEKNQEYKLDAGEYVIRITAEKGATGKINIKAE